MHQWFEKILENDRVSSLDGRKRSLNRFQIFCHYGFYAKGNNPSSVIYKQVKRLSIICSCSQAWLLIIIKIEF
jgi:hypothetical protein